MLSHDLAHLRDYFGEKTGRFMRLTPVQVRQIYHCLDNAMEQAQHMETNGSPQHLVDESDLPGNVISLLHRLDMPSHGYFPDGAA